MTEAAVAGATSNGAPIRPGTWVPSFAAWAARVGELADGDYAAVGSPDGPVYSGSQLRELRMTEDAVWVTRWADGSRPAQPRNLSRRETEVLALIGQGISIDQAAAELHIHRETVRSHLASIYRKLGVRDRAQAVAVAWKEGLVHR